MIYHYLAYYSYQLYYPNLFYMEVKQEQQQLEGVNRCLTYDSGSCSSSPESSAAHRDRQLGHEGLHQSSGRSQARALGNRKRHLGDRSPVRHSANRSPSARQAQPASRQALPVEARQHRPAASARPLQEAAGKLLSAPAAHRRGARDADHHQGALDDAGEGSAMPPGPDNIC